jgi:hypothetical protein
MQPLWNTWRCRRNANFFMQALAGFFVLLIVSAIIRQNDLGQYVAPVLIALSLLAAVWLGQAIRRARTRHRERLPRSPLSRDELRVARSKLMNDRKVKSL